ncbi:MAG: hypothetical protein A2X49_15240 [Lentisphaerae bacterium GWF2_52_8]|nr:MAG: hypothetical protein A2X49_15240 [Lentisphaerae bacterium GWF2_52_8]
MQKQAARQITALPSTVSGSYSKDTAEAFAIKILRALDRKLRIENFAIRESKKGESVHQFRVTIRKIRTLLSQFKNIFPKKRIRSLREKFGAAAKLASPVRDFDVFLSQRDAYLAGLPEKLRPQARIFFRKMRKARAENFFVLQRFLDSKEFGELEREWDDFISRKNMPQKRQARAPLAEALAVLLQKQFGKLRRQTAKAGKNSAHQAHLLRIECKNTRYLLEAASPLPDSSGLKAASSSIKKMQGHLGSWHDLSVQRKLLREAPEPLRKELLSLLAKRQEKALRFWRKKIKGFERATAGF